MLYRDTSIVGKTVEEESRFRKEEEEGAKLGTKASGVAMIFRCGDLYSEAPRCVTDR